MKIHYTYFDKLIFCLLFHFFLSCSNTSQIGHNKIPKNSSPVELSKLKKQTNLDSNNYLEKISLSWKKLEKKNYYTPDSVKYLSFTIDNSGNLYTAYQINKVSYQKSFKNQVLVDKFSNGKWQNIGGNSFFQDVYFISIATDSKGVLYLAYKDRNKQEKAFVKKYENNVWEDIGEASERDAKYVSIAMFNDELYIAYTCEHSRYKAVVKKLETNNLSWQNIGSSEGISKGYASDIKLISQNENGLYLIYSDGSNHEKISVHKLIDSSWQNLGIVSEGKATATSLITSNDGSVYVSYSDYQNKGTLSVKKYNNNIWETIGSNLSHSPIGVTSLAISDTGSIYVAYQNRNNLFNIELQKYENNNWIMLENQFNEGIIDLAMIVYQNRIYLSYIQQFQDIFSSAFVDYIDEVDI